ncbi:exocyst complex subunit sec15-like protein [Dermatophagoides farinae]|uniref:Exocyst complex component 6 n=1 Tax=Dermatophagoides farinae TaxID=6954 RepID=A0A9D4NTM0_DERFA|nr:exocyst complex subunit sec15-like protein [Dermatophagoides farinae]
MFNNQFRSPKNFANNNNTTLIINNSPSRFNNNNHHHHHQRISKTNVNNNNNVEKHLSNNSIINNGERWNIDDDNRNINQHKQQPKNDLSLSPIINIPLNNNNNNRKNILIKQRQKGLSHSITDLRDLKEKSKRLMDPNHQNCCNDHFEYEIKERRIDMYIAEIEMDPVFQLGSTIRAIYDGDEHDRFMEKLDMRIKNHDKDIERMCNCHYQGFVDCIHELLKVRPQAQDLKSEINQINHELLKSSENIQRKADELIKYRRVLCNTKTAIEYLQECLPMLETFSKLDQQMNEKKYYSALKTLEQFERLYMSKFKKYRFAQTMCLRVPKIRETIKKESMKDLKDFLENIRQLTFKIGEIAMKNTAIRYKSKDFAMILSTTTTLNNRDKNIDHSKYIRSSNGDKINGLNQNDDDNNNNNGINSDNEDDYMMMIQEELSATDLVDFSPVYRCLHIFGCLGARGQFESYYRQQRKQQARLILQSFSITPPQSLSVSAAAAAASITNVFNRENFKNYLFGVVGFFVIEDHLLNTSNGLVTKEYLEENWNDIIKSLIESIHFQATLCQDSEQMLYMKNMLMLFCETTHNYGYAVESIMKLLVELRQLYTDILLKQWSLVFRKIFDSDTYHPLVVNNIREFNEYFNELNGDELQMFNDNDDTIQKMDTFPKRFSFSLFVPQVYKKVKEFIIVCLKFIEDLNLSDSDKEDTVRKSTNLLLTRTLSDSLSSLIKKPNLGLLQLIQISINTNYLEESSIALEVFISELIHRKNTKEKSSDNFTSSNRLKYSLSLSEPASQSHLARLQGRTMFKDSRSEAESQIYIQLNNKIEEFFSLANYNYMLSDSPGKASSYILDLMAFLKSTFEAFTNLPSKVAQTACLSACKFISSRLLNILLEDDVKAISHGFLQQFNLDLMQCEMFAGSEPVKEFEEGALQSCFAELRQTMDLFIEFDSWSTYFAEYGKNESRYLRVNPQTALILLEKLVRGDNKKTIFSALSKNERDKKNKIDTILKKLKQLITNN